MIQDTRISMDHRKVPLLKIIRIHLRISLMSKHNDKIYSSRNPKYCHTHTRLQQQCQF